MIGSLAQTIDLPAVPFASYGPVLVVFVTAAVVLLVSVTLAPRPWVLGAIALLGLAGAAAVNGLVWQQALEGEARFDLAGMVATDGFTAYFGWLFILIAALGSIACVGWLETRAGFRGEYLGLLLLSTSGMMLMAASADLIMVFLSLEVLSIALYALAAFARERGDSQEAGIKYFVLGAFSSAIFLYGVALTYGATGTTNLAGIADALRAGDSSSVGIAGLVLLLVGLGFKVAAAPFHVWTPDVYQGAPTPAVTFMAAGAKAAGFAGLLRVLYGAFPSVIDQWEGPIAVLAIASVIFGSVVAVVQDDAKRLLAYSAVGHSGYMLLGFLPGSTDGLRAVLFYAAAYSFAVIGSFAVLSVVGGHEGPLGVDAFRGLAQRKPALAGALAILLFSQAGVPLTAGFVAKFAVFGAAVDGGWESPVIIAVLASVVGFFFYLRLVVLMYMSPVLADAPGAMRAEPDVDGWSGIVIGASLALTLFFGFYAQPLWELVERAVPII